MADQTSQARSAGADTGSIAGNAVGDQATADDRLGFTPYVEAIARFLTSKATKPPLTISIEGEWGSGKSSFLLQLERAIGGVRIRTPLSRRLPRWAGGLGSAAVTRKHTALSVRFNAWRHDKQDALWAAFALAFVKSLRTEVGLIRAWRGDVLLFFKRLNGWAFAVFLLSLLAMLLGAFEAWHLVKTHPNQAGLLLDWLVAVKPDKSTTSTEQDFAPALRQALSTGGFGAIAAIGLAGLYKYRTFLKLPLTLQLEKYISKPDYEGHTSFIEEFHLDLNRLVEAYAGDRRVFIFIDDLDRCDVPRAADLMQAINLMIGDTRNLVFIIGMDREKVAAGIAQKYKDILPFLRDSAHWKPNDEKDNYTPLYFGYGYLEKFIQISFSLPIAADEAALESFFRDDPPPPPGWGARLWAYWKPRLPRLPGSAPPEAAEAADPTPPPGSAPISPEAAAEREYIRLEVDRDSERVRDIVKAVSGLFEYNPRRIKQFINTFRLALYIASDLGLFDKEGARGPDATPEQIGKFVALLLRFPDLRFVLDEDRSLLRKLQEAAFTWPEQRNLAYHWLDKPGAVQLLKFGCEPGRSSDQYSLAAFDINRLFSVLPRVAGPLDASSTELSIFDELARRYDDIRRSEPSSNARTAKMTNVAEEAISQAGRLSPSSATAVLARLAVGARSGRRLMRILIASAHRTPANLPWLLDYNGNFVSPFEHFWCIQTLILHTDLMSQDQRARVAASLTSHWLAISADPGRIRAAQELRRLVTSRPRSGSASGPTSAPASSSAKTAAPSAKRPATKRSAASPEASTKPMKK